MLKNTGLISSKTSLVFFGALVSWSGRRVNPQAYGPLDSTHPDPSTLAGRWRSPAVPRPSPVGPGAIARAVQTAVCIIRRNHNQSPNTSHILISVIHLFLIVRVLHFRSVPRVAPRPGSRVGPTGPRTDGRSGRPPVFVAFCELLICT